MLEAMKAGNEVKNPTVLKNVQNTTNSIAALVSVGVVCARAFGYDLPITDEQIVVVAGGVATLLGVFNRVVTTVTSKKVGYAK